MNHTEIRKNSQLGVWLPTVVMLVWLVAMIYLLLSAKYRTYLMAEYFALLIGSILILGLLSIYPLIYKMNRDTRVDLGTWLNSILLIIPLVYLLSSTNVSLGVYAMSKRALTFAPDQSMMKRYTPRMDKQHLRPRIVAEGGVLITTYADPEDKSPDRKAPEGSVLIEEYIDNSAGGSGNAEKRLVRIYAVGADTIYTSTDQSDLEPVEINLLDLLVRSEDLHRRQVITEGKCYKAESLTNRSLVLFRFAVTCCVADARPMAVIVNSETPITVDNEAWLRVHGEVDLRKLEDNLIVTINAEEVETIPTPPPDRQYIFF